MLDGFNNVNGRAQLCITMSGKANVKPGCVVTGGKAMKEANGGGYILFSNAGND